MLCLPDVERVATRRLINVFPIIAAIDHHHPPRHATTPLLMLVAMPREERRAAMLRCFADGDAYVALFAAPLCRSRRRQRYAVCPLRIAGSA
jgi:hypothetical protein